MERTCHQFGKKTEKLMEIVALVELMPLSVSREKYIRRYFFTWGLNRPFLPAGDFSSLDLKISEFVLCVCSLIFQKKPKQVSNIKIF